MLDGAAILAAGVVLGRFLPARRRGHRLRKDKGPVCGCTHHVSFHAGGSGRCHKISSWDNSGCRCQKYTGPEPLPEFYAPEIG